MSITNRNRHYTLLYDNHLALNFYKATTILEMCKTRLETE